MLRTRQLSRLLVAVALFVFISVVPIHAIGPWSLMFYSDSMRPVTVEGSAFASVADFVSFAEVFWNHARGGADYQTGRGGTIPPNLEGRPYVSLAIFWGRRDEPEKLKPEDASQHARLYLPIGSKPAVIVVTEARMINPKAYRNPGVSPIPEPVPAPKSLEEFIAGWELSSQQMANLRSLVPLD